MYQTEYNYKGKLKAYGEETKQLKGEIRELIEYLRNYERKFKGQQEWLVVLEHRHKEVCDELGISASLNFSHQEESNKMKTALSPKYRVKKKKIEYNPLVKGKYFGYDADEEDETDAQLAFSKDNFEKMRMAC